MEEETELKTGNTPHAIRKQVKICNITPKIPNEQKANPEKHHWQVVYLTPHPWKKTWLTQYIASNNGKVLVSLISELRETREREKG